MSQTACTYRSCEESIRRSPITAVLAAFLAGVLVRILPVGSLIGALIRLLAALIRPALLIFGIARAIELARVTCGPNRGIGKDPARGETVKM